MTICIAIAAAIASMIAAANQSDHGLGAVLSAILSYQQLMANQLLSIQKGLADLMAAVSDLNAEMQAQFQLNRMMVIHSQITAAVSGFRQELSRASTYSQSYKTWQNDDKTQTTLADLDNRLRDAVDHIESQGWLDPVTALYLSVGATAYLAIRSARMEQPAQLRADAQRFLTIYDRVEDPNQPGSAAAQLEQGKANYQKLAQSLLGMGLQLPTADSDGLVLPVLLGVVTIQDYTPPTPTGRELSQCKHAPRGRVDGDPEDCRYFAEMTKERVGGSGTYALVGDVTLRMLRDSRGGSTGFAFRQYIAPATLKVVPYESKDFLASSVPASDAIPTERVDALALGWSGAATASQRGKSAEAARATLAATIESLNLELSNVALSLGGLTAVASGRIGIFKLFGEAVA